jgi:hypothetical protein
MNYSSIPMDKYEGNYTFCLVGKVFVTLLIALVQLVNVLISPYFCLTLHVSI